MQSVILMDISKPSVTDNSDSPAFGNLAWNFYEVASNTR